MRPTDGYLAECMSGRAAVDPRFTKISRHYCQRRYDDWRTTQDRIGSPVRLRETASRLMAKAKIPPSTGWFGRLTGHRVLDFTAMLAGPH